VIKYGRSKTEHIENKFDEREQVNETKDVITISKNELGEVGNFKYLESFVQKNMTVFMRM